MLIFQAGGERTTVPRWDSSSYLRCCAWITVVKKGQFMIHKTNIKCDIGLGLGGESCGVLTWYYFINSYSSAQVFRFKPVGLFLSELAFCQRCDLFLWIHWDNVGSWLCQVGLHCLPSWISSSHSVASLVCPAQGGSRFIFDLNVYPCSWMEQLWTLFSTMWDWTETCVIKNWSHTEIYLQHSLPEITKSTQWPHDSWILLGLSSVLPQERNTTKQLLCLFKGLSNAF